MCILFYSHLPIDIRAARSKDQFSILYIYSYIYVYYMLLASVWMLTTSKIVMNKFKKENDALPHELELMLMKQILLKYIY